LIWTILLLGLTQGLCEFLPVSSSGHLVLLQNLFGLSETALQGSALAFDIMLHVGTLAAVCVMFRKDIWAILKHLLLFLAALFTFNKKNIQLVARQPAGKLVRGLIYATLPLVAAALLFYDEITALFDGGFLGYAFLLTALLLTLSEVMSKRSAARKSHSRRETDAVRPYQALCMGMMQLLSLLPGLSRSGSTISGGLMSGVSRKQAARFSFLMSIPAILGSLVMEGKDMLQNGIGDISWGLVLLGMFTAFLSGLFAIGFMMRMLEKRRLFGFAVYTLFLGAAVLTGVVVLQYIVLGAGVAVLIGLGVVSLLNKLVISDPLPPDAGSSRPARRRQP
jgi:undecaprenyl-diphosphatase